MEVRTGFDRSWASGFEIAAFDPKADAYRLRRLSDGAELPVTFPADDVRRARRDNSLWWM